MAAQTSTEPTYGLNELARVARVSKSTILEMLRDGRLVGQRSETGRHEWRITQRAAIAAGLRTESPITVDSALRECVAAELAPVLELVRESHRELVNRLDRIESQNCVRQSDGFWSAVRRRLQRLSETMQRWRGSAHPNCPLDPDSNRSSSR